MAQNQQRGRNPLRQELIAELDAIFPPSLFRQWSQHRNNGWTPRKVVWTSVVMFWISGRTLEEQFSAARRIVRFMKPHWKMPSSYSGFVDAQIRYLALIGPMLKSCLQPDDSERQTCRTRGWMVLAVDGSRFECPRSSANERGLGCAGRLKTQPQIFYTHLQHVGTGLLWDFRMGPGTDSEQPHLHEMLPDLPENTLLTADAGFITYDLASQLIDSTQRFVLRIGGNKTLLTCLREDTEDDSIVYYWPQSRQHLPPLKVRRIEFSSTGGLPVVLITNELDANVLSDDDARSIYKSRWGIEVYFRHLKQTMGFARTRSRTPETVMNEHCWRIISFGTLHRMAVSSQLAAGQQPHAFSAAKARREIREVLQLMQLQQYGEPLRKRWLKATVDSYTRTGPKATRKWPRKKNDKPPRPPRIRNAKKTEVQKAKQLGYKALLIS